jgi:hypothetical protein
MEKGRAVGEYRLWSPLAAAYGEQIVASTAKAWSEQSIELAREKLTVYVPPQAPAGSACPVRQKHTA